MALGYHDAERLKWVAPGVLLNESGKEVVILKDTCELCGNSFFGTEHIDPGENPVELAISMCGKC